MSEAVREAKQKGRPEFRNIGITDITSKYRMPPSAIVSILHRVSGAGMFLALPFLLYLFQQSLLSESSFGYFAGIVSHPLAKLVLLGLSWAYLFMDNHFALDKDAAQSTARWVLVISLLLTAVVGLKLFGVF
jgi:succinate dehydrogenase / fumarate reductase cytochrome b subunit